MAVTPPVGSFPRLSRHTVEERLNPERTTPPLLPTLASLLQAPHSPPPLTPDRIAQQAPSEAPASMEATAFVVDSTVEAKIVQNWTQEGEVFDLLTMGSHQFPIKEAARGTSHRIYAFRQESVTDHSGKTFASPPLVRIGAETFSTQKAVVRSPITSIAQEVRTVMRKDLKGLQAFESAGVQSPRCYYQTPLGRNQGEQEPALKRRRISSQGKQWIMIMQKIPHKVSCEGWRDGKTYSQLSQKDKETIDFVQEKLTSSAEEGKEIIGDFYPPNVRRDEEGRFYLIDPTAPENDPDDFENPFVENLYGYLLSWSNGNEEIFHHLISRFPQGIKAVMTVHLTNGKKQNNGTFPRSKRDLSKD